jgi:ribonuclease HII
MLLNCYNPHVIEAGCDEAGRGCLAGSVFAAAVILPKDYDNPDFNDSKQLSKKKRYALREQIIRDAVAWAVGIVTPKEIDQINILHASFLAMHRAIDQLTTRPEALIIDGNRFDPYKPVREGAFAGREKRVPVAPGDPAILPYHCIVKGDGKYQNIAAASILAKTFRDDYMDELHQQYPMYDWNNNKGYPTRKHREAITRYGITPFHRKSYNLLGCRQLELNFDEK